MTYREQCFKTQEDGPVIRFLCGERLRPLAEKYLDYPLQECQILCYKCVSCRWRQTYFDHLDTFSSDEIGTWSKYTCDKCKTHTMKLECIYEVRA